MYWCNTNNNITEHCLRGVGVMKSTNCERRKCIPEEAEGNEQIIRAARSSTQKLSPPTYDGPSTQHRLKCTHILYTPRLSEHTKPLVSESGTAVDQHTRDGYFPKVEWTAGMYYSRDAIWFNNYFRKCRWPIAVYFLHLSLWCFRIRHELKTYLRRLNTHDGVLTCCCNNIFIGRRSIYFKNPIHHTTGEQHDEAYDDTLYIIESVERTKKILKSHRIGAVWRWYEPSRTYNRVLHCNRGIVANVRRVLGSPHLSGGGGDNDTPTYPPHAQSVPTASGRNNPRASLVFAYLPHRVQHARSEYLLLDVRGVYT